MEPAFNAHLDNIRQNRILPDIGESFMPRFSPFVTLEKSLTKLVAERQTHAHALARIDALFGKFGVSVAAPVPVAAAVAVVPASDNVATSSRRKRSKVTGEEFVLSLLAGKSLITREINEAWIAAGRKGNADTTLWMLAKKKMVTRTPRKDGPGSDYTAA